MFACRLRDIILLCDLSSSLKYVSYHYHLNLFESLKQYQGSEGTLPT
jgi:hypothetical protein